MVFTPLNTSNDKQPEEVTSFKPLPTTSSFKPIENSSSFNPIVKEENWFKGIGKELLSAGKGLVQSAARTQAGLLGPFMPIDKEEKGLSVGLINGLTAGIAKPQVSKLYGIEENAPGQAVGEFVGSSILWGKAFSLLNKAVPALKLSPIRYNDAPNVVKAKLLSNLKKAFGSNAALGGIFTAASEVPNVLSGEHTVGEAASTTAVGAGVAGAMGAGFEYASHALAARFANKLMGYIKKGQEKTGAIKSAVEKRVIGKPVPKTEYNSLSGQMELFPKTATHKIMPTKPAWNKLTDLEKYAIIDKTELNTYPGQRFDAMMHEMKFSNDERKAFVQMVLGTDKGRFKAPTPGAIAPQSRMDVERVERAAEWMFKNFPGDEWKDVKNLRWAMKRLESTDFTPKAFDKLWFGHFINGYSAFDQTGMRNVKEQIDLSRTKMVSQINEFEQTNSAITKLIQREALGNQEVVTLKRKNVALALMGDKSPAELTAAEKTAFNYFRKVREKWANIFGLKDILTPEQQVAKLSPKLQQEYSLLKTPELRSKFYKAHNIDTSKGAYIKDYYTEILNDVAKTNQKLIDSELKRGYSTTIDDEFLVLSDALSQKVNYLKARKANLTADQINMNSQEVMSLYNRAMANLERRRYIIDYKEKFLERNPWLKTDKFQTNLDELETTVKEAVQNMTAQEKKAKTSFKAMEEQINGILDAIKFPQDKRVNFGPNPARTVSRAIVNGLSLSFLTPLGGLRKSTSYVGRNLTQNVLATAYVEPKYQAKAVADYVRRGFKLSPELQELSRVHRIYRMNNIHGAPELSEQLTTRLGNQAKNVSQRIENALFYPVTASGKFNADVTLEAAYQEFRAKGASKVQSLMHADYVARMTQYLYTAESKSAFAKAHPVISLFSSWPTNFASYLAATATDKGLTRLGITMTLMEAIGITGQQYDPAYKKVRPSHVFMGNPLMTDPITGVIDLLDEIAIAQDSGDWKKVTNVLMDMYETMTPIGVAQKSYLPTREQKQRKRAKEQYKRDHRRASYYPEKQGMSESFMANTTFPDMNNPFQERRA